MKKTTLLLTVALTSFLSFAAQAEVISDNGRCDTRVHHVLSRSYKPLFSNDYVKLEHGQQKAYAGKKSTVLYIGCNQGELETWFGYRTNYQTTGRIWLNDFYSRTSIRCAQSIPEILTNNEMESEISNFTYGPGNTFSTSTRSGNTAFKGIDGRYLTVKCMIDGNYKVISYEHRF